MMLKLIFCSRSEKDSVRWVDGVFSLISSNQRDITGSSLRLRVLLESAQMDHNQTQSIDISVDRQQVSSSAHRYSNAEDSDDDDNRYQENVKELATSPKRSLFKPNSLTQKVSIAIPQTREKRVTVMQLTIEEARHLQLSDMYVVPWL